jgi:DNA-binding NarL/FixJ family response regulator
MVDLTSEDSAPEHSPSERSGLSRLAPRDAEIVGARLAGYSEMEIANRLLTSLPHVEANLNAIYEKLGVIDALELALAMAYQRLDSTGTRR